MVGNGSSSRTPPPAQATTGPVRTCVGCRERSPRSALLRVVARTGESGETLVVPDERRTLPGRGAWIHEDLRCVELAERRRAFVRALRVPAPVDIRALRQQIEKYT